ncbi:unnamed protein product [Schistocephalus solidus]|uniref:SET domain-containing protein n=1 Tax=Schistocephalus solidus TaxID=70667 RepID=A0A183TC20_SCHSO|nr:unnamed protein product [Schistocephalus solidus]
MAGVGSNPIDAAEFFTKNPRSSRPKPRTVLVTLELVCHKVAIAALSEIRFSNVASRKISKGFQGRDHRPSIQAEKELLNLAGKISAGVILNRLNGHQERVKNPAEKLLDKRYPKRLQEKEYSAKLAGDPEDDGYLYCHTCECRVINTCEKHLIIWVKNVVVDDCDATHSGDINLCSCSRDGIAHAKKTAPEEYVFVGRSSIPSAGLGVWSEKEIPLGTIFGPYGGEIVYLDALSPEELERVSLLLPLFFFPERCASTSTTTMFCIEQKLHSRICCSFFLF